MGSKGYIRKKRGYVTATVTPQTKDAGRRSTVTAEVVPIVEHEDILVRYVDALLDQGARSFADRNAIATDLRSPNTARIAVYRAKKALREQGHEADEKAVDRAMCSRHGEALAQDLASANEPMRETVREVAREWVAMYLEKRPQTSEDCDLLMQKARARAGARAVWRQLLRIGLAAPSMSRTVKHQDGSTVQTKVHSGPELLARMTALDESAMRAGLTVDARIATQRERGGLQVTSGMQSRLERVLMQEANAHAEARKLLEARLAEKSTTIDAPPTDTRESVQISQVPAASSVHNVPSREHVPVAPSAPPAAPQTAPGPSSPAPAPSAPGGVQSPPSTWHEPTQQEKDRLEISGLGYASAKRLVMGQWYGREQDAQNRWDASGKRGRRPLTPQFIPAPLSTWLRKDMPHEVAFAESNFGWVFERETNA